MNDRDLNLLQSMYERYLSSNQHSLLFSFSGMTLKEKKLCLDSLDYLKESGFIGIDLIGTHFYKCHITESGIMLIKNGIIPCNPFPSINGSNNIVISAPGNTISNSRCRCKR